MTAKNAYGLIGYPLSHSFSRRYFTDFFEKESIDAVYLNFEISDLARLPQILDEHPNLVGFNVTIPHKQAVLAFLDEIDPLAKEIGAVNTVRIEWKEGKRQLHGFNTDWTGFRNSIQPHLKPSHHKALVLGTGGASKAVVAALKGLSLVPLLVSREAKEGICIAYADLTPEILKTYTVIINTTPLGTFPKTEGCPEIPYQELTPDHLLYDLVYNPPLTRFLAQGEEMGATVVNGLKMLELQAIAAWEIWQEGRKG
ncbi:MAG: shikimate dehydrogenase [Marinilabiliales bacterium]|nr:shikimate dehydrogenase [Marinilabiliales bacterium]